MKVVFFGTSNYCLPVLEALKKNFDLKLVVTRPDKPVGREKILTPSATKLWAQKNNIPFATEIKIVDCGLAIVADFGQIIPEEIFNKPKLGTFNIHFSKLPDLRGASPVQSALLRDDTTAWITVFELEKSLDTGPILDQRSFPILPDDTAQTLYIRLFEEVAKYLPTLDFSGKLTPQSGTPIYCKTLTRQDGFVEWKDIEKPETYNKFRAYFPWPGLWSIKDDKRMKILKCHLASPRLVRLGRKKNRLVLDQIQFEGGLPHVPTASEIL